MGPLEVWTMPVDAAPVCGDAVSSDTQAARKAEQIAAMTTRADTRVPLDIGRTIMVSFSSWSYGVDQYKATKGGTCMIGQHDLTAECAGNCH
jgi:hypothetical protein